MAKNDRSASDQGRVRFRVIEVEMDGSNATLAEGIKTLATALGRSTTIVQPMKTVAQPNGAVALGAGAATEEPLADNGGEDTERVAAPARKAPANRKLPSLTPVPGIDWDAEPSIKNFMNELDLGDSTLKKYTAIFYWFSEHRQTPVITIHHIFSAYKALGWHDLPKFASDTFKDLKNKREYKWIEAGDKRGEYKINAYGAQQVAKWHKTN